MAEPATQDQVNALQEECASLEKAVALEIEAFELRAKKIKLEARLSDIRSVDPEEMQRAMSEPSDV